MQELALGGLRPKPRRQLHRIAQQFKQTGEATIRARPELKPGTRLMREWQGRTYDVLVLDDGFSCVRTSVRRITFAMASGYPYQHDFALAHDQLTNAAAR